MEKTELLSIVQKSGLFSLYKDNHKEFECFANLVAKSKQEDCAKICEEEAKSRFQEAEFDSINGSIALNEAGRALMIAAEKIRNRSHA